MSQKLSDCLKLATYELYRTGLPAVYWARMSRECYEALALELVGLPLQLRIVAGIVADQMDIVSYGTAFGTVYLEVDPYLRGDNILMGRGGHSALEDYEEVEG